MFVDIANVKKCFVESSPTLKAERPLTRFSTLASLHCILMCYTDSEYKSTKLLFKYFIMI